METTPMAGNFMPSQAQLALAMAIVKQKPAGIDVEDYVLQIRKNIKNAESCGRDYLEDRFFDSVSFWQHAYKKSEAEQSRLMDRIYELEQRNEALITKLQSQNSLSQEAQVSVKRKANGNLNARKRAKTQVNLQSQAFGMALESSKLVEQPEYMEETTASFMRHFYALQRAIQCRPSRSTIVQTSADLCEVAVHEVLTSVRWRGHTTRPSKKPVLQAKRPHLEQVLHSVKCAFQLILQALEKLAETENDLHGKGQLAYHLIRLYQAIATALEQYCISKSGQIPASTGSSKTPKNKQARKSKSAKPCQGLENLTTTPVDEVASQISRLLGSIAISLNLSYTVHRTLFEGLLYILLTRVGTLLCIFVFQGLQIRPDLHVDQTKLPLPQGLQGVKLDDLSLHSMQMEAKHLIWPLERSLALLDTCVSSSSTLGPQDAPETMAWVAKMKQQLQGTLLQALFGSDRSVFPHTLQQPETLDTHELERLQNCTQIPEQSVPDWFTQEIWRLLGWDLLATQDIS
ncbi:uncharacterized protein NFIA_074750 [Aspergillus fischeri NRRL 181]|uniref:Uncharacterized protein n=1 Tax=Neosartorya fischeri (strain ATCC 1020 / DSM 3700 / CBS 544.65 / FGSC A1164 / JCM 1740 / NRRL 181 / WB 181) TaxID=331117 RepID=A1DDU8_NEOFI|nr:conserved hypothetical protein [Aspergillus fischeri NRRL 181]EAW17555.1 conserved hypothetical protein [Aspergillus fischeri NRRL 181]KAG2025505.1 hypothetical protein GB937_002759 [Aspergillus fischeri]